MLFRSKAQIQEDQIRVTGKNRDDLQAVIALLRKLDLPIEIGRASCRERV